MLDYLSLALGGLPLGAMYALQALGIVVVYKTSKVFTFASGAVGMTSAYVASELNVTWHVPIVLTVLLAVAVGILVGLLMELTVRFVPGAINRTVVTLGWLIGLQGLMGALFGTQSGRPAATVVPPRTLLSVHSLKLAYGEDQIFVFVVALALAVGLGAFFHRTALGTSMRAVADEPEAAGLLGLRVTRVTMIAWGLGGGICGLGGVLVSPLLSSLDTLSLVIFTIQGLAAALVGRLQSLPLTFVGGLALGAVQPVVGHALSSYRLTGLNELTALVVILVALVLRRRTGRGDTGQGGLVPAAAVALPDRRVLLAGGAGVLLAAVVLPLVGGTTWHVDLALVCIWSLAVLSIVLLTGVVGQVSVCQAVFMAMGAFGAAIAVHHGVPFVIALPVGGLFAAATAVLVGLPAIRLAPLELAIATLSLAFTADRFLYDWPVLRSKDSGRALPRPGFASTAIDHIAAGQRNYLWLVLALLAVCSVAVARLRRGRMGAALTALRSSEAATSAMGFSVPSVKLRGFAFSGFLAGLAGAAYAGLNEIANGKAFDTTRSISLLAYAVIAGVGSVPGALVGGIIVTLSTLSFGSGSGLASGRSTSIVTMLTGALLIGVITLAPNGLTGLASGAARRFGSWRPKPTPSAYEAV